MNEVDIIKWDREGDIGFLSIYNGKGNYLDTPDFISLDQLKNWTSEDGLKGIIIHGVGRNFSAGANTKKLVELSMNKDLLSQKMNEGKKILDYIEDLNIPVIAAINGVCFGGGLEIALAAHMRVASTKALLAFPEINHGIIPGLGGVYRLSELVHKGSYEILLNGDMLSAEKAKEIGLVDYVSEEKNAIGLAKEKLDNMVKDRSIEVIQSVMQSIRNSKSLDKDDALKAETELFCKLAVNVKTLQ